MNVYLDIDGVLLANDLTPANHSKEFLAYIICKYPNSTYWLTTHCQGDSNVPVQHIGHLFDEETVGIMRKIKPTTWDLAKTRGIDFTQPFIWFDDDLFHEEKLTLLDNEVLDNWIKVDLRENPNQLGLFLDSFPVPVNLLN
ncbi:MAG: hypothetical protein NTX11_02010 [Candidatus Saccharibacteria bacterium]|nr:hypothetical protein [Candidatus Saccharibacteria bacterium]